MRTVKNVIGMFLLYLVASSCTNSTISKIIFEKDFATGHADWKVAGDTITKQFDLQLPDSKEPMKLFYLVAKDAGGCMRISYARVERANLDSKMTTDSVKAHAVPCGMGWESADSTRYEQMVLTGSFSKFSGIRKNVKQGSFLILKGNGTFTVN
ncbi:MAG: hypothetical protein GXO46_13865 [Chlorobi bacterium]|nr:hypothetical protein [Chlorobiota bacterium]